VPPAVLKDHERLAGRPLPPPFPELLAPAECQAVVKRARALVKSGRFPVDSGGRRYPWPLV